MANYDSLFDEAGKQFNVDPALLKSMMLKESSGDPTAVSPKGATGLMQLMPGTAQDLGVTDRTDPRQNIFGGAKYMSGLLDKYKDVPTALAAYNAGPGAVDKHGGIPPYPETQNYVKTISQRYQGNQMASQDNNDAFSQYFGDKKSAPVQQKGDAFDQYFGESQPVQQIAQASSQEQSPPLNLGEIRGTSATVQQPEQEQSVIGEIGRQIGLTGRAGIAGIMGIPNMLGDAANSLINLGVQGTNKVLGTNIPEMALPSQATQELMTQAGLPQPKNATERVVQSVAGSMASVFPSVSLGKALATSAQPAVSAIGQGLAQSPGIQVMGAAGAGAGGGISQESGAGPVGQIAATLGGALAGTGAGAGVSRIATGTTNTGQMLLSQALKDRENNAVPLTSAETKPRLKLNSDGTYTEIPPKGSLAEALQNSKEPFKSPPEAPIPNAQNPQTGLNSQRQLDNIDTLKRIGLEEQRPSTISGNRYVAGEEYETSKLNNELGLVMRGQLQKEQEALKAYGQKLISDTGAPTATPETIGQTIRKPLEDLSIRYDQKIGELYKTADQIAKGNPIVTIDNLKSLLDTNSAFAGKAENSALRRGVRAYLKEQEVTPDVPIDVKTAEGIRQYLNSQWSPQNSGLIGKLKEAIDTDVSTAAGGDIYKSARALHAERKAVLDNPNGIAKLLNNEGPNGVNQAIPDEKVGEKLIGLPTSQFNHIINTLKNAPGEVSPQAQEALSQIKAVLANKIYQAGDRGGTQNGPSIWNAANVTRELNALSSKLKLVFSKQEMEAFKTLNDAGHILQTPMQYKGAAAQGYNYLQAGVLTGLPAASAGLGATMFGPTGAAAGSALGGALSKSAKQTIDKQMASKYAEALKNPVPQFPK